LRVVRRRPPSRFQQVYFTGLKFSPVFYLSGNPCALPPGRHRYEFDSYGDEKDVFIKSFPFHYNEATKSAALINGRPNSKDESLSREGDFR